MASICLAFHLHQPFVLRRYSVFDRGIHYFDGYKTRDACQRFAARSILPTNRVLLGLLRQSGGRFRFSCTISGTAIDLLRRYVPEVLGSFHQLRDTGHVEFLAMPYDNTLAFLHSGTAFAEQIEQHRRTIEGLFGQSPRVFRNSELICGDDVADAAAGLGFSGALCEGSADVLAGRTCSRIYAGGEARLPLLLRNAPLSRDVSERFADRGWDQWPLTAPRYAEWLARFDRDEEVVLLEWHYGTFGLTHAEDTGIFEFLKHLPDKVLGYPHLRFVTAGEALAAHPVVDTYRSPCKSPAEQGGHLSGWLGNPLQSHALHQLMALESHVRATGDPRLLEDWRRLQACEYFAAMNTEATGKPAACGWTTPPDSPYDAYINYMNIIDSLIARTGAAAAFAV